MSARYVIGIDLGTTNSVVAFAETEAPEATVCLLRIPQLVAASTIEERDSLPSFLYLGDERDQARGHLKMPWSEESDHAVGEFARSQSADLPDRTVTAAKSWLCHHRVDRNAAILPWQAPQDVARISPVEASRRILHHIVRVWETRFPDAPIHEQEVVLTVPASFDPGARELTRAAAIEAGLPDSLILFEEPQAAVYAWLLDTKEQWRQQMQVGDTLLVVDVGGGTTDLTLIEVQDDEGNLALRRQAVGNHLLVGGDNMDLALAYQASERFAEQGLQLDPWQSVALWHQCRAAKEALLSESGEDTQTLTVMGRSSRLIGGSISVEINRDDVRTALLEGFFPRCQLTDPVERHRASGFQEIGLPFESETGITRHVAAFLNCQGAAGRAAEPTRILYNGGVFRSTAIRERVQEVVGSWFDQPVTAVNLEGQNELDHSVARGAAFYGWSKRRGHVRIRGGTARSYYVGIETSGLAIPGGQRPLRALCVVPHGMEEGTEINVPSGEIGLIVGESAQFRFFGSSSRQDDVAGTLLSRWAPDELLESAPIEAVLPADESLEESYVPVRFLSRVTELGTLELWCVSTKSDARWKLEFNVRDQPSAPTAADDISH